MRYTNIQFDAREFTNINEPRLQDYANRVIDPISAPCYGIPDDQARALAPSPELLLLDEPLSALDLKLRQAMRDELRELQRQPFQKMALIYLVTLPFWVSMIVRVYAWLIILSNAMKALLEKHFGLLVSQKTSIHCFSTTERC